MDISDRVVVLNYGRKIGDGLPEEAHRKCRAYPGRALMGPFLKPCSAA